MAWTYIERLRLEVYYSEKLSKSEIAKRLNKSIRTIFYELKRGYYERLDGKSYKYYRAYSADRAEMSAKWLASARGRPIKLDKNQAFVTTLSTLLREHKRSPYHVSDYCKENGIADISPSTIYRYIDRGYIPGISNKDLPERGKRKRGYKKLRRAAKAPKGLSIEQRPDLSSRDVFGHWEIDTIVGKAKGKGQAVLVLTERKTRYEIIFKLKCHNMESVNKALKRLFQQTKGVVPFLSFTCDNGSEFADLFKQALPVYYCHPYSSYERGSNERNNRDLRRCLPKGASLRPVTVSQLADVQTWINTMYRPKLRTSAEKLFCAECQKWKNEQEKTATNIDI